MSNDKKMIIDYASHYDDNYWTSKKTYQTPDGREHVYHGPALSWDGFQYVVDTLTPFIPGKTLLDIGCGGGDLAKRFMGKGYDAYGVDISKHALANCVPEMVNRLALADITTVPKPMHAFHDASLTLPTAYDVVLATDLLEHIYEEDLDKTFDWMIESANRWLFFCVATAQAPNSPFFVDNKMEFVAKKGQPIPLEYQATAVSGHVNVRHWKYWAKFFISKKLKIRWDGMYCFQLAREMIEPWKQTGGWNMGTTWLLEK